LAEFLERRRQVAETYAPFFEKRLPEIEFQRCPPNTRHAYWKFTINLPREVDRVKLQARLREEYNISVNWSYFPPIHLQPVFQRLYGTRAGQCPVAEDVCRRCLSLPMYSHLSLSDAEYVCDAFETVYKSLG
jgi:dTDP-4-amino-4,6-dideoxygalactose transaminase